MVATCADGPSLFTALIHSPFFQLMMGFSTVLAQIWEFGEMQAWKTEMCPPFEGRKLMFCQNKMHKAWCLVLTQNVGSYLPAGRCEAKHKIVKGPRTTWMSLLSLQRMCTRLGKKNMFCSVWK